jgi:ABC-2 type transport system permease protein
VLYPDALWLPKFTNILLFVIVVALAFTLRFIIQYTFAIFAFWTERVASIEELWYLIYLFCAGVIAPLEVFPPLMQKILLWTPFPYLVHFPTAILIGLPVNIPRGLLMMAGWITLFFMLNRWLWKKGLKKYSGMGA